MKIAINTLSMRSLSHGMGRYIGNIVNHLLSIDQTNQYFLYVSSRNRPYFNFLPNDRVILKEINCPTSIRLLWEQFVLPFDLKGEKVDVFWGPAFAAPLFKNTKRVITIHDMTWFITPETHSLVKKVYFQTMLSLLSKKVDVIISDSESTTNDICRILSVPRDKIKTILLGINESFGKEQKQGRFDEVRQKYNLPQNFIFFLGVLEPRKNIEGLISAFEIFKASGNQDVGLVIGGSRQYGWKNSAVFELVEQSPTKSEVFFTDRIDDDDLPLIYRLAKLFVLPSFYEGFGLPILEAQACGCPVITSKISSMPEVGGEGALYIDPHNVEELASAIKTVLTDSNLRMELIRKGTDNIKRFSWEKTARETLRALENAHAL